MRILVSLLILCATQAQAGYFFINAGVGKNSNLTGASIPWQDAGEAGCMFQAGHVWQVSDGWYASGEYSHYSQCLAGKPFNNDPESSLDSLYLILEYRIYY